MQYKDFYKELINEAITLSPDINSNEQMPILKNSDVVTVYHGFNTPSIAINVCKYGLSGKELITRIYSYESNNNPYGLFVTSKLPIAKRFVTEFKNLSVILEFNAKVKDLEAPIWPEGSYTIQGGMSKYWGGASLADKMKERELARLKTRQTILQSPRKDYEFAKKSDNPELALTLFYNGEFQALFVGDLNPNMIRAVWVYDGPNNPRYATYTRMSRKDFLKKYDKSSKESDTHDKLYLPNDDWKGLDDFIIRLSKKMNYDIQDLKDSIKYLIDNSDDSLIYQFEKNLWPKQFKQALKDLNLDPNNKYFHKEQINEALSISFSKQFTDEEKKQATEILKKYIKDNYKYYTDTFGELAASRYDFILKNIHDDWKRPVYTFNIVGKGGKTITAPAYPWADTPQMKKYTHSIRKYRDVKNAIDEIPVNPDSAYRGMSFEELMDAKKKGYFKSSGIMNIGDSQENYTFFGDSPSTAKFYGASFQPVPSSATRNKPGVIIEVPKNILTPANITLSKKTQKPVGNNHEFVTDKPIDFSNVKNLWLIVPEKSSLGTIEVIYDKLSGKTSEGSRYPADLTYKLIHKKGMI